MEPVEYTVQRIDGDYAILVTNQGLENTVARALLPEEIEEGTRLLWENFSYSVL